MALMHYTARWLVSVAVVVVLLGLFARLGYIIAEGLSEPFVVSRTEVLTPVVHAGQSVKVTFSVERRRLCLATIAEFWIDRSTGAVVHRSRVPGGYAPLGAGTSTVNLAVPPGIGPGRYAYRSIMESDCGLTAFAYPVPDAAFEIVP